MTFPRVQAIGPALLLNRSAGISRAYQLVCLGAKISFSESAKRLLITCRSVVTYPIKYFIALSSWRLFASNIWRESALRPDAMAING